MKIFLLVSYPIFCWGVFIFCGLEAMQRQLFLPVVIVTLGLGGMSQNYWQSQLSGKQPYPRGTLISFWIGLVAAITYSFVVAWYFLVQL